MAGLQTNIPALQLLAEKRKVYVYTTNNGAYPPHLKYKYGIFDLFKRPFTKETNPTKLFDPKVLAEIKPLVFANHDVPTRAASLLGFITPNSVKDFMVAQSFADVNAFNSDNQSKKRATAHGTKKNPNAPDQQQDTVGDRPKQDWYTDAVFAQQQFTGTNPTTITLASQ